MKRVYFQRTKWRLSLSNLLQLKCYNGITIPDHASYFCCFNCSIEESHLPWFRPLILDSVWFLSPDNIFKSVTLAYHLWDSNVCDHPAESYSLVLSMNTVSLFFSLLFWGGKGCGARCWWFCMGFVQFVFLLYSNNSSQLLKNLKQTMKWSIRRSHAKLYICGFSLVRN